MKSENERDARVEVTGTMDVGVALSAPPSAVLPSALLVSERRAIAEAPEDTGNLTHLKLTTLGSRPYKRPEVVPAWWRLRSTHDSISGLFDTLLMVRQERAKQQNKSTRGRLHSDAQDLLRAAIVFTSAGVDASVQALIHHAVPKLITVPGNTPRAKYEVFVEEHMRAPKPDVDFMTAVKAADPGAELLDLYIRSKTKASFQGSGDLHERAGGALGIKNQQLPKRRFNALDDFFTARNDVAHRIDMEMYDQRGNQRPLRKLRVQRDVLKMCDAALILVRDMIRATADNLSACP